MHLSDEKGIFLALVSANYSRIWRFQTEPGFSTCLLTANAGTLACPAQPFRFLHGTAQVPMYVRGRSRDVQGVCTALHLACGSLFACPAFVNQLPLLISDSLALSFILAGLLLKCRFLDLAVAKS